MTHPTSGPGQSFGDVAGEMADETETEAPLHQKGASAGHSSPEDHVPTEEQAAPDVVREASDLDDISGIDNWMEEGGPLEPEDVAEAEQADADELAVTQMALAERTADLQRLQAEFLNYKRRVERDRELLRENASYTALLPILDVLDTIDRAREHGPLDDGFKAVVDQLTGAVASRGLVRYGEPGDPFDPTLHEALSHLGVEEGIEATTVKVVAKAGYKIGDRVVRAAQVLVVDPA